MKSLLILLIAVGLFSSCMAVFAKPVGDSPGERLTLAKVLTNVRSHYPALVAAWQRVKSVRERIPQERAWEDPNVTFEANVIGETDQAVTVRQTIPISGRNLSQGRVAEAEAARAYQAWRKTELEALRDARVAYFQYAQAQGLLELNTRDKDILTQLAEATRAKFESGNQTQAEVLMAESELARNDEARADLERQSSDAQSELNRLMGRLPQTVLPPPEDLQPVMALPDLVTMQAHALRHSPEVQMAKAEIAAALAKQQLAHRQWIPEPMAGLKARRFKEAGESEPMDELMAEVSFNVPWVNGRKYSAGVRESEAGLAAAKAQLRATEDEIRAHMRDALAKAESFSHHVELYRQKIIPLAQQALESAQLGFETNKSTLLDTLNAQKRLRDDEAMALQHLAGMHMALAEITAITGSDSPENSSATSKSHHH
jgi:outer membrane protein TolC